MIIDEGKPKYTEGKLTCCHSVQRQRDDKANPSLHSEKAETNQLPIERTSQVTASTVVTSCFSTKISAFLPACICFV